MNNTKDHEHSTVQEFYRRMAREAEINSDYTIDTHNESLDECSHRDYIFELLKIENLVNLIISSDLPGFSLKKIRNGNPILTWHPLAKHFKLITKLFELVSTEYEYSPNVELFFASCFKLELGKEYLCNPLHYGHRPIRESLHK